MADPHDRNVVRAADHSARIIDVVAAPLPVEIFNGHPVMRDWIERARQDPRAELLPAADDSEL